MRFEFHCAAFTEPDASVPHQLLGGTNMNNLDWVTKRAGCSLKSVFSRVKTDVQQDILTRNTIAERSIFSFKDNGDSFSVFVGSESSRAPTVDFKRSDGCIVVSSNGDEVLKATVTLDDKGECILVVAGKETFDWQFRQMALEGLFFGTR
jgi:hypothetical protein